MRIVFVLGSFCQQEVGKKRRCDMTDLLQQFAQTGKPALSFILPAAQRLRSTRP